MTNNKFLKLAVMAMISSAAFTAQVASAGGLSCDDWSFNDQSCSAYIRPSGKMAEGVQQAITGVFCADWSYNDPSCPAFPTATAAGGMQPSGAGMRGTAEGPLCSDWSFNDKSCSASIH